MKSELDGGKRERQLTVEIKVLILDLTWKKFFYSDQLIYLFL